jgi:hypothetical protein
MRIVLLNDVMAEDRFGNKTIRTTIRLNRGTAFAWRKGVQMEVSEATGHKMIAAGDAAEVPTVAA